MKESDRKSVRPCHCNGCTNAHASLPVAPFVCLFGCFGAEASPTRVFCLFACLAHSLLFVVALRDERASARGTNNRASITRCDNTSRGISFSEAMIARPVPRSIARARSEKREHDEIEHDHSLWIWTAVWDDNERTNTTVTIWRVVRTCATHFVVTRAPGCCLTCFGKFAMLAGARPNSWAQIPLVCIERIHCGQLGLLANLMWVTRPNRWMHACPQEGRRSRGTVRTDGYTWNELSESA